MVVKIKRALFALLVLVAILMVSIPVEAATRKKSGSSKKAAVDKDESKASDLAAEGAAIQAELAK